ncbi:MAG: GerAB/ArcD/ProY family transporter [Clostridia bacterium]
MNLGSIQGQREAFSLGVVALTSQLFHLLYVDHPDTLNAGWISALAAGIPALLLCLCLHFISKGQKDAPACQMKCAGGRIFCAVLCLASLFDLGCSTRLFADTAKYTALDSMTLPALILPLLLVLAAACVRGGMAISGAARVWLCVMGLLFLVRLLTLFPRFNPRWLFPVLGPGAPALIRPIPSLLGALTGIVPLWLITHPDKAPLKRWNLATLSAVVCVMVACAVALCAMLLPAMLDVPTQEAVGEDLLHARCPAHAPLPIRPLHDQRPRALAASVHPDHHLVRQHDDTARLFSAVRGGHAVSGPSARALPPRGVPVRACGAAACVFPHRRARDA